MTIEEMIALMTAYKEGKKIECRKSGEESDPWKRIDSPGWNWYYYDYRVAPQPKYRPFANAEEVMEAIKEHGDWVKNKKGCYLKILIIAKNIEFGGNIMEYSDVLQEGWTFADGTPFGKLEE